MTQQVAIAIRILDKEFQIGCPADERQALKASADYLNEQMRMIKDSGVAGMDRIAILAALNITRELLDRKESSDTYQSINAELSQLSQYLSSVLRHINSESG